MPRRPPITEPNCRALRMSLARSLDIGQLALPKTHRWWEDGTGIGM